MTALALIDSGLGFDSELGSEEAFAAFPNPKLVRDGRDGAVKKARAMVVDVDWAIVSG